MTLRLPVELKERVIEEARVAGDRSRIVLFAMAHTDPKEVEVIQTRKTGLGLANPMFLHIGNEARVKLRERAEAESVSVNAIVVSMLEDFFKQLRKSRALRDDPNPLEAVSLPSTLVHLHLVLPRFSDAGSYVVAVSKDRAGTAIVARGSGKTRGDGQRLLLDVSLDLRGAQAGAYFLATVRESDNGTYYYPLNVQGR